MLDTMLSNLIRLLDYPRPVIKKDTISRSRSLKMPLSIMCRQGKMKSGEKLQIEICKTLKFPSGSYSTQKLINWTSSIITLVRTMSRKFCQLFLMRFSGLLWLNSQQVNFYHKETKCPKGLKVY
ncbi:UNVERIFIED_CONTAM: hypothetical protein GTU68_035284 [Idotea baltica]|nr:hypothetical protein [Idotea baltica]